MPNRFDPDNRNKSGLFDPVVSVEGHTDEHLAGASVNQQVPPGAMLMFVGAKSTIPSGWLLCDGRDMSRQEYAALFEAIGETFGAGDGSTTFGLPDMKGRFPIGVEAGKAVLADTGGTWDHGHGTADLTVTLAGLHTHGVEGSTGSSGSHSHSTEPAHSHSAGSLATGSSDTNGGTPNGSFWSSATSTHNHNVSGSTGSGGGHGHGSAGSHDHGVDQIDTNQTGSSHDHGIDGTTGTNNPPYLGLYFIIKT